MGSPPPFFNVVPTELFEILITISISMKVVRLLFI